MAVCSFASKPIQANSLVEEKSRILSEVKQTITDDALAAQITEIRFRREVLENKSNLKENSSIHRNASDSEDSKSSDSNIKKITNPIIQSQQSAHQSLKENKILLNSKISLYTGFGNSLKFGLSNKINNNSDYRIEVSGLKRTDSSKNIHNSIFRFDENNLSIGLLADWLVNESPFKLTLGLNINRIRTSIYPSTNTLSINGNQINLGSDIYQVDFKFPTVTPYIGVRFQSVNEDRLGLHFYGDAGLMIGKYDATAKTSLIGTKNIQVSDVDSELNSLRNNLYRRGYIPQINLGLSFGYN